MKMNNVFKLLFWGSFFVLSIFILIFVAIQLREQLYTEVKSETIKKTVIANATETTNTKVCVVDSFESSDGNELSHGDRVVGIINEVSPEINVERFEFTEVVFDKNNQFLMDCDIINFSMSTKSKDSQFIKIYKYFMKEYKGYVVVAAGNPVEDEKTGKLIDDTYDLTLWSLLKNKYKNELWSDRIFILSQGFMKDEKMNIHMSYGEEIDYVVQLGITNDKGHGTSFASPYFTALLFKQLEYGEEITYKLKFNNNQKDGYYKYID